MSLCSRRLKFLCGLSPANWRVQFYRGGGELRLPFNRQTRLALHTNRLPAITLRLAPRSLRLRWGLALARSSAVGGQAYRAMRLPGCRFLCSRILRMWQY